MSARAWAFSPAPTRPQNVSSAPRYSASARAPRSSAFDLLGAQPAMTKSPVRSVRTFTQASERPARYALSARFPTTPSSPRLRTCSNTRMPDPSMCSE